MPDKAPFTLFKPTNAPVIGQYAPDRDFGLMGTAVLRIAVDQLTTRQLDTASAQRFLSDNRIQIADIDAVIVALAKAVDKFREPGSKLPVLMRDCGVLSQPKAAVTYVMSRFGEVCLGFYFDCVRSVVAGHADPTMEDRRLLLDRVAELVKDRSSFRIPAWVPWTLVAIQSALLAVCMLL